MQKFNRPIAVLTVICYCIFSSPAHANLPPISLSQMYSYASRGNVPALRAAVQRGLNIDAMDRNGNTGMCYAIYRNDITAYNAFRSAGANPRHGCISNIPEAQYDSFMANPGVADVNSSSKAAYGMFNKGEYIISEKVWWTAGALLLIGGGIALAAGGGGGGGGGKGGYKKTDSLGGLVGTKKPITAPGSYTGVVIDSDTNNTNGIVVENNYQTTAPDETMKDIKDILDFTGNIKEYAEYIRVGMKTNTFRDTVTNTVVLDLKDATAGLVATGENKKATNNGELRINATNGTIGMIASEKAEAINNNVIQMNFSGTEAKHQVIGMYADSISKITNNNKINTASSQNAAAGTIVGMATRITDHEESPLPSEKSIAINSASGEIKLTNSKSDGAETKVNLIGMGSFLDKDFIEGKKSISNAGYTYLENQGDIILQSNISGGSKYGSNVKSGDGGIVGMLADAHSTAKNMGDIKITLSGIAADYNNAQAGMLSTHGGMIENAAGGNIEITGGTGGYGMIAVQGAGTSSQFNTLVPKISNSGTITIDSVDGFGIASYHQGFTNIPPEIENTATGNIHLTSKGTGIYSTTGRVANLGTILLDAAGNGITIKTDGETPRYDINSTLVQNSNSITVKNALNSAGIWAEAGSVLNSGTITLENLTTTTADSKSYGIYVKEGVAGNLVTNLGNININIFNSSAGTTETYGIYSEKVNIENSAAGTITLEQEGTGMFSTDGRIDNYGNVKLNNGGTGIETTNGHINNHKTITVTGTEPGTGIKTTDGVINNISEINITSNESKGIDSNNFVLNQTGAEINVTGKDGIGINLGANGTVINDGEINITSGNNLSGSEHYGIKSAATTAKSIVNNGDINLVSTLLIAGTGNAAYGISSENGNIENNGSINVVKFYGVGIHSETGIIRNNGSITMDNAGIGLSGGAGSQISNLANKEIKITSQSLNTTSYGIKSDAGTTAINQGKITIDVANSFGTHMKDGVAMNSGTITMGGDGASGMHGEGTNISTNSNAITMSGFQSSGMTSSGGTSLNSGTITITGNESIGMSGINGATISNGGTITISGNDGTGMYVEGDSTATNSGTINLTGSGGGYGMYAKESKIYNAAGGTINVKAGMIGMFATGAGAEVYNQGQIFVDGAGVVGPCNTATGCGSWIVLDDGAEFKNGGLVQSAIAIDFNSLSDGTGKTYVAKGGTFEAEEISGEVYADSSIVKDGFEKEYTNENSFVGEDTGIELNSGSYMFDSKLVQKEDGSHDIVMTMKDMHEIVDDSSLADFLENNYNLENGEGLFAALKSANNQNNFGSAVSNQLGLDFFPSFSRQNLEAMKSLNRSMNQALFSSDNTKEISGKTGYDFYNKNQERSGAVAGYKENVHSIYAVVEKRHNDNLSYGAGASVSQINSKYKNGSKRDDALFQVFSPIKYRSNDFTFLSTARLGVGFGEYERHVSGDIHKADTLNYVYGVTNEIRKDIDLGAFTLEPTAEFNVIGIHQNKTKEKDQITVKSSNDISVEAGLGLYAKKSFEIDEDNSVNFRVGGTYYQELNSSYDNATASMSGMVGNYNMKGYEAQRYRGVASGRVEYKHKDVKFFTEASKLIEKDGSYDFKAGIALEF